MWISWLRDDEGRSASRWAFSMFFSWREISSLSVLRLDRLVPLCLIRISSDESVLGLSLCRRECRLRVSPLSGTTSSLFR